jgi:flavoprotein
MTLASQIELPFTSEHRIPPHAVPIALPTYWTPEQAIAVFELVDDLRETIWSIYQTHLQDLTRQQRQSPVIGRFEIDDHDLPF